MSEQQREEKLGTPKSGETQPRHGQAAQNWGERPEEGEVVGSGGKSGGESPNEQERREQGA